MARTTRPITHTEVQKLKPSTKIYPYMTVTDSFSWSKPPARKFDVSATNFPTVTNEP